MPRTFSAFCTPCPAWWQQLLLVLSLHSASCRQHFHHVSPLIACPLVALLHGGNSLLVLSVHSASCRQHFHHVSPLTACPLVALGQHASANLARNFLEVAKQLQNAGHGWHQSSPLLTWICSTALAWMLWWATSPQTFCIVFTEHCSGLSDSSPHIQLRLIQVKLR